MRISVFIVLMLCLSAGTTASVEVPEARNLAELGERAKQDKLPILLMVSQDGCSFCEKLKEEILEPMLISGDYTDRVIISELMMDSYGNITGFEGESVHPSDVATQYRVWVTPTILFLDAKGREVQARMLGVNTIEMYGYYLDESIAGAIRAIRDEDALPYVPSNEDLGIKDLTNSAM